MITVYFNSSDSDPGAPNDRVCVLSEVGLILVEDVANRWSSSDQGSIKIVGHDDSLKNEDLSLKVSECRASATAEAFIGLGVPENKIIKEARGETDPAYSAGDGVSEPLNRRVDVSW